MKKELERRLTDMCNLSEGIREEGFKIGYQAAEQDYKPMFDEFKVTIIVLMLQQGHSMIEALNKAKVPLEDEPEVRELIKKEYPELLIQ